MNAVARSLYMNTVDCLKFNYEKDDSTLVKVAKVAASITLYAAIGTGSSFVGISLASAPFAFIPAGLAIGAGVGALSGIIVSTYKLMMMRNNPSNQPPVEETPAPVEETPAPAEETPAPAEETPVDQQPPVEEKKSFLENNSALIHAGVILGGTLFGLGLLRR